jgi:hypothetical protein
MLSDLYTQKWEPMLFCIFKYSRIKIFVTGAPQSAHGQQIYSFPLGEVHCVIRDKVKRFSSPFRSRQEDE